MLITVVVGNGTVVAANDAHRVIALAVQSSRNINSNLSPSTGVPDRLVVIEVIAAANPVNFIISTLSVFVVGVAQGAFVVTSLLVTLLFVNVSVLDIVGTFTPLACSLPVPLGTRFMFILVEEPVAVSVIVPVPQAT